MDIKEIKSVEVMPGFKGRIIHGSDFTWVYWEIEKGASLKEHNHVNEQLMHVIEGEFEFTIQGEKNICKKEIVSLSLFNSSVIFLKSIFINLI